MVRGVGGRPERCAAAADGGRACHVDTAMDLAKGPKGPSSARRSPRAAAKSPRPKSRSCGGGSAPERGAAGAVCAAPMPPARSSGSGCRGVWGMSRYVDVWRPGSREVWRRRCRAAVICRAIL